MLQPFARDRGDSTNEPKHEDEASHLNESLRHGGVFLLVDGLLERWVGVGYANRDTVINKAYQDEHAAKEP